MYLVMALTEDKEVDIIGRAVTLNLSWADGMVGVVPVFKTLKDAEAYVGDSDTQILQVNQEAEYFEVEEYEKTYK